jgi:DNA-directed RNA polymerase specialized sigma24 family protein
MIFQERQEIGVTALQILSPRQREILTRFHLHEQTAEQIRREMGLTETQFRLAKSRAKAQFGAISKKLARKHAGRALMPSDGATKTKIACA